MTQGRRSFLKALSSIPLLGVLFEEQPENLRIEGLPATTRDPQPKHPEIHYSPHTPITFCGTTTPVNPCTGQAYYDANNNIFKVYDGKTWIIMGR